MFGFLNPGKHETRYRRAYCRCCHHLSLHYGIPAIPFHSFESVFLFLYALDCGAIDESALPRKPVCRLRPSRKILRDMDAGIGEFTASLSLVLASVKLQDDIKDDKSLKARCLNRFLQKRIRKAYEYFCSLDSQFLDKINQMIEDHHRTEAAHEAVALHDYVKPTSEAFGYTFGLLAKSSTMRGHAGTLIALGKQIGAAVICYDCAADWNRDKRKGLFNPVSTATAAVEAVATCQAYLWRAVQLCRSTFGNEGLTGRSLGAVHDRVFRRCCAVCSDIPSIKSCVTTCSAPYKQSRESVVLYDVVCFVPCDPEETGQTCCVGCCCATCCLMYVTGGC